VQGIQAVRQRLVTDPDIYRLDCSALLAGGMTNVGIYALDGVLQQPDPAGWINRVKQARAYNFSPDPDLLEFAGHIRRVYQAIDFLSPALVYLVKSGRAMDAIRAFIGK